MLRQPLSFHSNASNLKFYNSIVLNIYTIFLLGIAKIRGKSRLVKQIISIFA